MRQPGPGEGSVVRYSPKNGGWELKVEGVSMLLGTWWLETAVRGEVGVRGDVGDDKKLYQILTR